MRVIVLSFDRLPACSLGCYGELNFATPGFDLLAESSLVLNHYYVSPDQPDLVHQLGSVAFPRVLIHSGPMESSREALFPERVRVESPDQLPSALHKQIIDNGIEGETQLICVQIPVPEPSHDALSAAASVCLKANAEEFQTLLGPKPKDPAAALDPFHRAGALATLSEWKQRLLLSTAETLELDAILVRLLEPCASASGPDDLLLVTSSSGDIRRGPEKSTHWLESLCEPVVHLPVLIQSVHAAAGRSDEFCSTPDLVEMVLAWLQSSLAPDDFLARLQRVEIRYSSLSARAIRTASWLLVEERVVSSSDEAERRLFRKPEDVWEILDVASQYPDLVAALCQGKVSERFHVERSSPEPPTDGS